MHTAVDNSPPASTTCPREESEEFELRWLTSVGGAPAGHHTLRVTAAGVVTASLLRSPLPRWSATTAAWAATLRWSLQITPRVLRSTDPFAERLGVTDRAGALVIFEEGCGRGRVSIQHELIVLAGFADQAMPKGLQQLEA
jgi:hypothetical protein